MAEPIVAADQRPAVGVDRGEVLLGELNCVACHPGTAEFKTRLSSKQPPVLANAGTRLTPQFLKSFLANPQTEKPGTTMPDVLGALDAGKKAEVVDALANYLASLGKPEANGAVSAEPFKMEQGKKLYHTVGCVACHEPFEPATGGDSIPVSLKKTSIPLGHPAHKTTVAELAKFLVDPLSVRPSGRMPAMGLSESEATLIAIYLLRDQAPGLADPSQMEKVAGLKFHYFEANRKADQPTGDTTVISDYLDNYPGNLPDGAKNAIRLVKSGTANKFGIELRQTDDAFGFLFDGYINAPDDGEYTFFSASDDGSRLFIDGKLVVSNDGDHPADEKSGKITLAKGDHAIRLSYYENSGQESLTVSWQGPGFQKQEIPSGVLSHMGQAMKPTDAIEFAVDQTKAGKGRTYFQQYGCANCHGIPDKGPAMLALFRVKNFSELKKLDAGCLADQPPGDAANYHLTADQRTELRKTMSNSSALDQPLTVQAEVDHTMARLNCFACHNRGKIGGPVEERRAYFTSIGNADLGDEGRIPPHLTGVGAKLKADWLKEMLTQGTKVRPYMATRMPRFGEANVSTLIALLPNVDGGDVPDRPMTASLEDAKFGRKLVGNTGLSCISCHMFGEFKSLGIPAMDLTMMSRRLRNDWFHRYLPNPAALRPGTRMPSFWPEGHAVNTEILSGNTDRQIDAIWAFLSDGPTAAPPDGLIQGKWEIVADKEAVIYRQFIEGAGTRAIGVGYPEKANLAWDANEMRLALIWQGPFIDASKQRTGRGEGWEGPLGYNVLKFAEGPPLAILSNVNAAWPTKTGNTAGFRMRGYRLDDDMRPAFNYDFTGVSVTDYPVAVPGVIDANFKRTLTFTSQNPPGNLWFRVITGSDIIQTDDGAWNVDGKVKIKFTSTPGKPVARKANGRAELLVPVKFTGRKAEIVEEIVW